ncbi:MAG: hypothetical protein IPF93_22150 [Saprospiraceae bacterium]|nr:hypothetical protein [Saprospiraceae bacterium]
MSGFQGTMSIGNKRLAIDKIDAGSIKSNGGQYRPPVGAGRSDHHELEQHSKRDLTDQEVLFTLVFTAPSVEETEGDVA